MIGDVVIGSETGIWFHCLVRGDMNFIRIGARTNIQDGTIIHVDSGELFDASSATTSRSGTTR